MNYVIIGYETGAFDVKFCANDEELHHVLEDIPATYECTMSLCTDMRNRFHIVSGGRVRYVQRCPKWIIGN